MGSKGVAGGWAEETVEERGVADCQPGEAVVDGVVGAVVVVVSEAWVETNPDEDCEEGQGAQARPEDE